MNTSPDVTTYISQFPQPVQDCLTQIRDLIHHLAPQAVEAISYGMPGYKLNGKPLVYFAGYNHHIGFYATPNGHAAFASELAAYKQGKGSVQFPLDQPLPLDLIQRIIQFRIAQTNP